MIVQVARLEAHHASRARVGFLLANLLVHPPVTFQQRAISKAGLAEIAGERFLHIAAGRRGETDGGRRARGYRRGMGDLVHPQMVQSNEGPRADPARISRLSLDNVFEFRTRGVTRSHVVVELKGASELKPARGARIGLGKDLHLIEQRLVRTHGLKMRGEQCR